MVLCSFGTNTFLGINRIVFCLFSSPAAERMECSLLRIVGIAFFWEGTGLNCVLLN